MAPRAYTLRRRATTAAATRLGIIEAAAEVYRERGVAGTTIGAVADRADVSRGTVVHHFGGADGLLEAVLEHVLATIEIPDERVLVGSTSPEDRIHRFVVAMVRFYERTTSWWEVFRRDLELPALHAREMTFWASFERLRGAALGAVASDRTVAATVGTLVHPGTLGTFREAGLGLDDTIDVIADLIVDLVHRRQEGPA